MSGYRRVVLLVSASCVMAACIGAVVRADDNTVSVWQNSSKPTIQKSVELTPNTLPKSSNFNCETTIVKKFPTNVQSEDCLTTTVLGLVGNSGIIFDGSPQQVPVEPPPPFFNLLPIQNQEEMITYSTGSVVGLYIHFYRSIRDKMPPLPSYINGFWKFVLNKNPDFSLRDADGKLMPANIYAMTFSPNGYWMLVDLPGNGIVRINLATFEIQPIATSLYQTGTYDSQAAQLAISNDGKTAVIKPANYGYFKVYDISRCDPDAVLPITGGVVPCPTRDYWNDLNTDISGLRAIYQPRFVNDEQISFTAMYDYASKPFKVATFTLTAPGVDPSGIQYLGLGDSFASGEGALSYSSQTDDTNNRCHLSTKNYASILTRQLYASGHSVACSGAVTDDVENSSSDYDGQVKDGIHRSDRENDEINGILANYTPGYLAQHEFVDQYKPDAVTLSIGGNDIGFEAILQSCVSPVALPKACYSTYEDRQELYQRVRDVFGSLVATYRTVLKPGKRVYVTGYPQIAAAGGSCGVNVHLETSEIEMSNDLIDYLNQTIEQAADRAGVRYVDISHALTGHRLCEASASNIAVNGLTAGRDRGVGPLRFIGTESYHPNALGHELLAAAIRNKTNNLTQPMPGGNPAATAPGQPSSLDERQLPKSGRVLNYQLYDSGLAPTGLQSGQSVEITTRRGLKPGTSYAIELDGHLLAHTTTDANGWLRQTVTVPASDTAGFAVITVSGQNQLGQNVVVTDTVYVDDGTVQACPAAFVSGQDADMDGLDDGCDGTIEFPPPVKLSGLTSGVTLTDNSITITLSH